jgi:hypothetical protein
MKLAVTHVNWVGVVSIVVEYELRFCGCSVLKESYDMRLGSKDSHGKVFRYESFVLSKVSSRVVRSKRKVYEIDKGTKISILSKFQDRPVVPKVKSLTKYLPGM